MCTNCIRLGCRKCLKVRGAGYTQLRRRFVKTRRCYQDTLNSGDSRGRFGVPKDQKCLRCQQRPRACDGRVPCNTCLATGSKRIINACRPARESQAQKCDQCRVKGVCKGRLCTTCISAKRNCNFTSADSLVRKIYPVLESAKETYDKIGDRLCPQCTARGTHEAFCRDHNPYLGCIRCFRVCTKVNKDEGCLLRYPAKVWEMDVATRRPKLRNNWADFAYGQPKKAKTGPFVNPVQRRRNQPETEGKRQARMAFNDDLYNPQRLEMSGLGRLCV